MKKTLIIGSFATVLALGLVGGTLAWSHGALAQGGWQERGWHERGHHMGGPGMGDMAGMGDMGGRGERGPMRMLEQFDQSGDGRVGQDEVDAVRGERFAAFDANGDGELALEEYETLWLDAMRLQMVRGFQRLDVDGDAAVTEAEFVEPFDGLVERFDQDGDGVVTQEELRERRAAMRDGRGDRRGPPSDRPGPGRAAD